jgi:peptidoglycan hydrolase CwlO-like protein
MGDTTNDDTSHYEGALLEDILDKVTVIAEGQTDIWNKLDTLDKSVATLKDDVSVLKQDVSVLKDDMVIVKQDVTVLKQDVSVLKDDMVIVKHAVTEQSTDLDDHEGRLKKLEQVAA